MTPETENNRSEIESLPLRKVVQIAWRAIKVRIWRSLLVVSGIILAISFLTYILCSDGLLRNVAAHGSPQLVDQLTKAGTLNQENAANQRIQTYWMVGLALLISFVGIVNAMLMSVTERFREIGTMKCLGALDTFVLRLFLLESAFEGTLGSALGLIIGLVLGYAEGFSAYGSDVWHLLPLNELGIIVVGCYVAGVVLTVVGALYPAYEAARMTPVMALRSEV